MTASVHTPAFRKPNQTRAARRRVELIASLTADLNRTPDTAERALIEQAAGLIVMREAMEQAVMRGEPVNTTEILKVSGAVTRCLSALRGKTGKPARPITEGTS